MHLKFLTTWQIQFSLCFYVPEGKLSVFSQWIIILTYSAKLFRNSSSIQMFVAGECCDNTKELNIISYQVKMLWQCMCFVDSKYSHVTVNCTKVWVVSGPRELCVFNYRNPLCGGLRGGFCLPKCIHSTLYSNFYFEFFYDILGTPF